MNRTLLAGIGLGAVLFAACADEVSRPSGGGSIQPGEKISGLYVANGVDDDSITRIDLETGVLRQVQLGKEPTRIARISDRVYVSLRNERAVVVLQEDGSTLNQIGRIQTGAEPFGVAATEQRVYVAASLSGSVDEYDAESFERLRSWRISGEPRWLALHGSGQALYVGSAYGGVLTRLDLNTGIASRVELPRIQGFNFNDGSTFEFAQRITGDIAVSPDQTSIYVPAMYVDNVTRIADVENIVEGDPCAGHGGARDPSTGGAGMAPPPGGGRECGGGGYDSTQKFNPVMVKIPVEPSNGVVSLAVAPEAIQLISGAQIVDDSGFPVSFESFSSYPSAVAVSPDSTTVFALLEGSAVMIAFAAELNTGGVHPPVADSAPTEPGRAPGGFRVPGAGFSPRNLIPVRTGEAPRGVAVIGDRVYVHSFFDRRVEEASLGQIQDLLNFTQTGVLDKAIDALNSDGSLRTLVAGNPRIVHTNTIDPDVDAGRRLFYAANNPKMATVGAGVSCVTCHFDGRTDGITWAFERGMRQTPNLAVNLADTLPVGWAGNVPTVADEGFSTSQKLMGGQGLTMSDGRKIEQFLLGLRTIDAPSRQVDNDAAARGAAVFANVGCISCHSGNAFTDGKVYPMLGLEAVNTPALISIAGSPPYFHDGSAQQLEDVIDRAASGQMGNPFTINAGEKADLVAYLKSL